MTVKSKENQTCCPEFDPAPWDEKVFEWEQKKFIKDHICTLFYMPVNFGKVMRRFDKTVKAAGAEVPGWLCLSDHTSQWNMNMYLAVDKEIPGAENITLSGKFFSKVYEGPYSDAGNWMKNFEALAKNKEFTVQKTYMWYTTCPKCAKKYGKNYVVIIAKID